MTTTISVREAEHDLAALLKRARAGEEIVIADGDAPGVRLAPVPAEKPSYRGRGILKGKITVPDSVFFDPMPKEELKLWTGEGDDT